MPTRIVLLVREPDSDHAAEFVVKEDFEQVLDLIVPLSQPSSALQMRQKVIHEKVDGGRVAVMPQHVAWIEEPAEG